MALLVAALLRILVSGDVIAALLGALVGALATLAGALLTHHLRRRGKVRCVVQSLAVEYVAREEAPDRIYFAFPLWFFNEKEVGITVDELRLSFYKSGRTLAQEELIKHNDVPLQAIELPARRPVERLASFVVDVADDEAGRAWGGKKTAEISWLYPDGRSETQTIPNPGGVIVWRSADSEITQSVHRPRPVEFRSRLRRFFFRT